MPATTPSFGLLGEPGQNYTFTRAGAPVGAAISGPVGPYPGGLGSNTPAELHGFFCIDYLKTATWNTSYPGAGCGVRDPIPGRTEAQLVEAAYLSRLHQPGGASANTYLYQGPISFATWEIMDPGARSRPDRSGGPALYSRSPAGVQRAQRHRGQLPQHPHFRA